jgi:Domain of unknown function (DUF4091)/FG-GAP-like repeat/Fibronectin type III domain
MDLATSIQSSLGQGIIGRARLSLLVLGSLAFFASFFFGGIPAGSAATSGGQTCSPTGTGDLPLAGGARVDVFDSLAQLLPSQPQVGGSTASICQARNATESFQVQVTAGASAVTVNSVSASALTGPGGAAIPASDISLFREEYTTLSTLSDGELENVLARNATTGKCEALDCRFPDALIPNVDPLFHEKRSAFPFAVPANQDRAVWVDAFVPPGQAPGLYTGTLTLSTSTGASTNLTVSLQVVNATLPSTSSVHSVFFLSRGRGLTGGQITGEQYAEYAQLGLDNRINIIPDGELLGGSETLEKYVGPLLSGTAPTILEGAELTDVPLGVASGVSNLARYKKLFEELKLASRLSIYCDEGTPQSCASGISELEKASPGLPVLVTAEPEWSASSSSIETYEKLLTAQGASLQGLIPIVEQLDPTSSGGDRLGTFDAWRAKQAGRQVWDYASCESGGCEAPYDGSSTLSGWPSYGIDQIATEQRAMGWQMFAQGIEGEEYWNVNNDTDAWSNPYNEGVNGDGTLFYPWNQAKVGGVQPIPVESIRLKRIRDGRQDYELLKLASQKSAADATTASNLAKGEFPSMRQSAPSASSFDATRAQLIGLFGAVLSPVPTAPTAVIARTANASAIVSWHAPASNGGAPLSGYVVSASPGGASCSTTGALSCVVKGLVNNTSYTFTVIAQSSSGSSAASVSSDPVVPVLLDSIADLNCDGTADFAAVQAESGRLLLYPRLKSGSSTDWAPDAPIVVGSGFGGSQATLQYRSIFFAGDMNGDGAPDLIGVTSTGQLMLLPGNCTGQVGAPLSIGASITYPIGAGDFNGDGHPDVIDRHSDGTLWLLAGTGKGTFGVAQHIGSGWGSFDTVIAAGDVNGDGHPDLIARESNGTLLLYEGSGTGGWTAATEQGGIVLAPKLPASEYPVLIGDGDFDQNATVDLSAINAGGQLLNFTGSAGNFAATGQVIGNGWVPGNLVQIVR